LTTGFVNGRLTSAEGVRRLQQRSRVRHCGITEQISSHHFSRFGIHRRADLAVDVESDGDIGVAQSV
jgi:hypothetical protein